MVRIEGYNVIINESGIKMMPLAAGNQIAQYTHDDFTDQFSSVFDISDEATKSWEFIYQEPFEEVVKEEPKKEIPKVAPVEEAQNDTIEEIEEYNQEEVPEIIPEEDITVEEDIKEKAYPDGKRDIESNDVEVSARAAVDMEYVTIKATLILEIETGLTDPEMATEETLRYLVEQDLEDMGYVVDKCELFKI